MIIVLLQGSNPNLRREILAAAHTQLMQHTCTCRDMDLGKPHPHAQHAPIIKTLAMYLFITYYICHTVCIHPTWKNIKCNSHCCLRQCTRQTYPLLFQITKSHCIQYFLFVGFFASVKCTRMHSN